MLLYEESTNKQSIFTSILEWKNSQDKKVCREFFAKQNETKEECPKKPFLQIKA